MIKNYIYFLIVALLLSYVSNILFCFSPIIIGTLGVSQNIWEPSMLIGLAILSSFFYLFAVFFNFRGGILPFWGSIEEKYIYNIVKEWANSKKKKILILLLYIFIYTLIGYFIFDIATLTVAGCSIATLISLKYFLNYFFWSTLLYLLVMAFIQVNLPLGAVFKINIPYY